MKAFALVALLLAAPVARAAEDAPLVLVAGQVAPVDGLLLPDSLAIESAKELAACRAEVPALKDAVAKSPSALVVVLIAVAALAVGGGVGAGVALSVSKQ